MGIDNSYMRDFCEAYHLKSGITEPRYYKISENPTCMELLLINHPRSFHKSQNESDCNEIIFSKSEAKNHKLSGV